MTDLELKAIVTRKQTTAIGFSGTALSAERLTAERAFKGEPYGDEVEGRSQVVSRDVAETVLGMLPPLMKPFDSCDEIVCFEPVAKKPRMGEPPMAAHLRSEEEASQASDLANYYVTKKNDAFRIIQD